MRDDVEEQVRRLLEEAERPMTVEEILPHLSPVMPTPNDVAAVLDDLQRAGRAEREGSYYAMPTPVPVEALFDTPALREAARVVVELIRELDARTGEGAPYAALVRAAKARGVPPDRVLDVVTRLKHKGEAYEPKGSALRLSKP